MFRVLLLLVAFSMTAWAYSVFENIHEEQEDDDRAVQLIPEETSQRSQPLKEFYEVDAFGPHFTDFGAQTGDHGAFTWHANYPIRTVVRKRTNKRGRY